ncbi:hypothetical protein A9Q91_02105 [Candidatus Gracilibacteria bacterium 28_42_T64]|nr:hypothetical protein A9Q91_02105 [Candidatus Gracilibacteria bacterium 28_42_T64]
MLFKKEELNKPILTISLAALLSTGGCGGEGPTVSTNDSGQNNVSESLATSNENITLDGGAPNSNIEIQKLSSGEVIYQTITDSNGKYQLNLREIQQDLEDDTQLIISSSSDIGTLDAIKTIVSSNNLVNAHLNLCTTQVTEILLGKNGENLGLYLNSDSSVNVELINKKISEILTDGLKLSDTNSDGKININDAHNCDNNDSTIITDRSVSFVTESIDTIKQDSNIIIVDRKYENSTLYLRLTKTDTDGYINISYNGEDWALYNDDSIAIYQGETLYIKETYKNGSVSIVETFTNSSTLSEGNTPESNGDTSQNLDEENIAENTTAIEVSNFSVEYPTVIEGPVGDQFEINWYDLGVIKNENNLAITATIKSGNNSSLEVNGGILAYRPSERYNGESQEIVLTLTYENGRSKDLVITINNVNTQNLYVKRLYCSSQIIENIEDDTFKEYWISDTVKPVWLNGYIKNDGCRYQNKEEYWVPKIANVYGITVVYQYKNRYQDTSNNSFYRDTGIVKFSDRDFTGEQRYLRPDGVWINFNLGSSRGDRGSATVRRYLERDAYFFNQLTPEQQALMEDKWDTSDDIIFGGGDSESPDVIIINDDEDETPILGGNEGNDDLDATTIYNPEGFLGRLNTYLSKKGVDTETLESSTRYDEGQIKNYISGGAYGTNEYKEYPFTVYTKYNRKGTGNDYPALVWIEFKVAPDYSTVSTMDRIEVNNSDHEEAVREFLIKEANNKQIEETIDNDSLIKKLRDFDYFDTVVLSNLTEVSLNYQVAIQQYLTLVGYNTRENYETLTGKSVYSSSFLEKIYNSGFLNDNEYNTYKQLIPDIDQVYSLMQSDEGLKELKRVYSPGLGSIDGTEKAIGDFIVGMIEIIDPSMLPELLSAVKKAMTNLINSDINLNLSNLPEYLVDGIEILENIDEIIDGYSDYDKGYYKSYIETHIALNLIPLSKLNKGKKLVSDDSKDLNTLKQANKFSKTLTFESKNGFQFKILQGAVKVQEHIKGNPLYEKALKDKPNKPKSYFYTTNSDEVIGLHKIALDKVPKDVFDINKTKSDGILVKLSDVGIYAKNGTNTDFMRIIIRKDGSVHGYPDVINGTNDIVIY